MSEQTKWLMQLSADTGQPTFQAYSPNEKQEISCFKFGDNPDHHPLIRNKCCLLVESNDNRAQIWLTDEVLSDIIAGLQSIVGR